MNNSIVNIVAINPNSNTQGLIICTAILDDADAIINMYEEFEPSVTYKMTMLTLQPWSDNNALSSRLMDHREYVLDCIRS